MERNILKGGKYIGRKEGRREKKEGKDAKEGQ
jgi:hypothetical protein